MGYTHYWTPKKANPEKFKIFSDTCKKLYNNLPENTNTAGGYYSNEKIEIGNSDGSKLKPIFENTYISFNGMGKNSHETFEINFNNTDWDFCKTARKPYDLLVCACLLAAADILNYEISSDGNFEDWEPAMKFYAETLKIVNFSEKEVMRKIKSN